MAMRRSSKKTCVVTGAGRRIGTAVARAFAREGATIMVTDKDADSAADVARKIGGQALRLDVSSEKDWEALAEVWPECDVVVNNAGITGFEEAMRPQDPETVSLEDWRAVHAVNLDGTFLGCRYAIRAMRPRGAGSIINISSRSSLVGVPAAAAYASSKAAVRNHTKSVALYCAEQGLNIRCNSIHPAAILTPICGSRCWVPARTARRAWRPSSRTRPCAGSASPTRSRRLRSCWPRMRRPT